MIEDSFNIDATPADLLAYIQRRLLHLDEVNKRLDATLNDIVKASERLLELSAPSRQKLMAA